MKKLQPDWLYSNPIDFEYKKYVLLDFLQSVYADFDINSLYPAMTEIPEHVRTLDILLDQRDDLWKHNRWMVGVDLLDDRLLPVFSEREPDDLEEIYKIAEYSIPRMRKAEMRGADRWRDISKAMEWNVVGVMPMYVDEGYFILHVAERVVYVYRYNVKNLTLGDGDYVGINLEIVDSEFSRTKTYEDIKLNLIRKNPDMPVPMTFSVSIPDLPLEETILPIVKRVGLGMIKGKQDI